MFVIRPRRKIVEMVGIDARVQRGRLDCCHHLLRGPRRLDDVLGDALTVVHPPSVRFGTPTALNLHFPSHSAFA